VTFIALVLAQALPGAGNPMRSPRRWLCGWCSDGVHSAKRGPMSSARMEWTSRRIHGRKRRMLAC